MILTGHSPPPPIITPSQIMARRMPAVPDGWFDYSPFGTPIAESRIIAVKTPLKQAFNNGKMKSLEACQQVDYHSGVSLDDEFTPTQLVERLKADGLNLRAVIDLTFTKRYYNPEEFEKFGVKYAKIMCPGKEIPNDIVYSQFVSALSNFLKDTSNGGLVAVHCTHGLNRTGYLVCRYLIEYCSYTAEEAIQGFNKARGYDIERVNYLEHLRNGCPPRNGAPRRYSPHPRSRAEKNRHSDSSKRDSPYSLSATNWAGHDINGEGRGNRRVRHRHRRRRGRSHKPSEQPVDPRISFHDESSVSHINSQARGESEEFAHTQSRPAHQNHMDASQWHGPYSNSFHVELRPHYHRQSREEEQLHSPDKFDHAHRNGFTDAQERFTGNEPMYSASFQAPPRHMTPVQRFHGPPGWIYNDDQYYDYDRL